MARHRDDDVNRPLVEEDEDEDDVIHLVQWVWEFYGRGAILDATDARLTWEFDAREMEAVMVVGLWCAHPETDLSRRPPPVAPSPPAHVAQPRSATSASA